MVGQTVAGLTNRSRKDSKPAWRKTLGSKSSMLACQTTQPLRYSVVHRQNACCCSGWASTARSLASASSSGPGPTGAAYVSRHSSARSSFTAAFSTAWR